MGSPRAVLSYRSRISPPENSVSSSSSAISTLFVSKDYSSKKLEIAVQDMKITAEQRSGIEMVKAYAKEKGIEVIITVVK